MRLVHAILLLLVVLLAWTCVIFAKPVAYDDDTLGVARNGSIARNLRHDPTTDDSLHIEEERLLLNEIISELRQKGITISATTSQEFHENRWNGVRKLTKSPKRLFAFLDLHNAGDDLFEDPRFIAWYTVLHRRYNSLDTTIFSVLTHYYNDHELASILVAGMNSGERKMKAAALRLQVLQRWFWEGKNYDFDKVFTLLKLDQAENVLDDPLLNVWVSFVHSSRQVQMNQDETLAVIREKLLSSPNSPVKDNVEGAAELANTVYDNWSQWF